MTGLQISTYLLAGTFAIATFFWFAALVGTFTSGSRNVERRVSKIKGRKESIFDGINQKKRQRKNSISRDGERSKYDKNSRLMNTIFNELVLAGVLMRPEEFCVVWLVLAFGPSGLTALFAKQVLPSVTLAAVGAAAPLLYLQSKKKKRVKLFESQLSDALVMTCNCLRSGLSFQQAMETIATDMSAPISTEFARTVNEIKYGSNMETAMNNMAHRVKSADLLLVVSAVNIQRQTGGNLSEILSTISNTIKERLKIKGEISALTAQGRMSGLIIGALPVVLGAVLMVINPSYMMTFFVTKSGNIMISVAVVMEIIGFFAIRKVVTIEY